MSVYETESVVVSRGFITVSVQSSVFLLSREPPVDVMLLVIVVVVVMGPVAPQIAAVAKGNLKSSSLPRDLPFCGTSCGLHSFCRSYSDVAIKNNTSVPRWRRSIGVLRWGLMPNPVLLPCLWLLLKSVWMVAILTPQQSPFSIDVNRYPRSVMPVGSAVRSG